MASCSGRPWISGTGTCGGPCDTWTVTTSPWVIGVLGAGDWLVIVLAGWVLFASGTGLIV
jgi:hypothetical protein